MIEEEYLARKYCEPKPYWHCLQELGEPPMSFLLLNELQGARFAVQNYPEHWLEAVRVCAKREPSLAARQLHRRVEAARAEFRAKQDKASGAGSVVRASFEKKEQAAWNTFTAQKEAYLKDYLKALETGAVLRQRPGRKCNECHVEKAIGRAKYCNACAKRRHREAVRANKKLNRSSRVISSVFDIAQSQLLVAA